MFPSSGLCGGLGLWLPFWYPNSTFVRRPQLWHTVSVFSFLPWYPFTRTHCAQCYPFFFILSVFWAFQAPAPAGGRTESSTRALHIFVFHLRLLNKTREREKTSTQSEPQDLQYMATHKHLTSSPNISSQSLNPFYKNTDWIPNNL